MVEGSHVKKASKAVFEPMFRVFQECWMVLEGFNQGAKIGEWGREKPSKLPDRWACLKMVSGASGRFEEE